MYLLTACTSSSCLGRPHARWSFRRSCLRRAVCAWPGAAPARGRCTATARARRSRWCWRHARHHGPDPHRGRRRGRLVLAVQRQTAAVSDQDRRRCRLGADAHGLSLRAALRRREAVMDEIGAPRTVGRHAGTRRDRARSRGLGHRFLGCWWIYWSFCDSPSGRQASLLFVRWASPAWCRRGVLLIGWAITSTSRSRTRAIARQARLRLRVVDGRAALALEQSFVRNALRALDALPLGYAVGRSPALRRERRSSATSSPTRSSCASRAGVPSDRRLARERAFNSLRVPPCCAWSARVDWRSASSATLCLRSERSTRVHASTHEEVAGYYRQKLTAT